jgi:hypothetical protein
MYLAKRVVSKVGALAKINKLLSLLLGQASWSYTAPGNLYLIFAG